jgi:hypothetical protein
LSNLIPRNVGLLSYLSLEPLGDTEQRYKSRFKNNSTAATIRDLLWNLEENRHHIQVILEPMAYRFPEADNLKTPYDDVLLKNKV